jgi:hypothetical protein
LWVDEFVSWRVCELIHSGLLGFREFISQ